MDYDLRYMAKVFATPEITEDLAAKSSAAYNRVL